MNMSNDLEYFDTLPQHIKDFFKYEDIQNSYLQKDDFELIPFERIKEMLKHFAKQETLNLYGPTHPNIRNF